MSGRERISGGCDEIQLFTHPHGCRVAWLLVATSMEPPLGGGEFFAENDASMMAIEYKHVPAHSIVFFFPFEGGHHYSHNFNPQSRTFNYSGHVSKNGSDKKNVLTYEISSTSPSTIICNETHYSLDAGTVFQVDDDGKISQLPSLGFNQPKSISSAKELSLRHPNEQLCSG